MLVAASLLAFDAGMVNGVCLVGAMHTAVSHVSGTSTQFGLALVVGNGKKAASCSWLLLSFLAGAVSCGFTIKSSALKLGLSAYSTALFGVALLLVLSRAAGVTPAGMYLASAAMGLQNGILTTYTGAVLRTTHVTGILTDIGLLSGRLLSRRLRQFVRAEAALLEDEAAEEKDELRRCELLVPLFCCFILGSGAGGVASEKVGFDSILIPAALSTALGVAYTSFRVVLGQRRSEAERQELGDIELAETGKGLMQAVRGLFASRQPQYEVVEG